MEAVAADLVSVVTMIPPGYSPAKLFANGISDAGAFLTHRFYFTLQMPAEQANILPKLKDFNSDIETSRPAGGVGRAVSACLVPKAMKSNPAAKSTNMVP